MSKKITIDAANKILGRLASELALILQGKDSPKFAAYKEGDTSVVVINSDKLNLSGKKLEQKKYYHHTGWPGGIREESLKELFKTDSSQVLRKAVWGMLPKNKLRARRMKRLKVYPGEAPNPKHQITNKS